MKNLLLAGVLTVPFFAGVLVAPLVIPAAAQTNTGWVLTTLGFAYSTYTSESNCQAAGAAITSGNAGAFVPTFYCVPVTNSTNNAHVVGGGYSMPAF